MKITDRLFLLLGMFSSSISLLFSLTDCRKDIFPTEMEQLLLLLAILGVMMTIYAYFGFHRSWKRVDGTGLSPHERALIKRILYCANGLMFLFPGSVVAAGLLNLEFVRSPMPTGIVGLAGGLMLMILGQLLFNDNREKDNVHPEE